MGFARFKKLINQIRKRGLEEVASKVSAFLSRFARAAQIGTFTIVHLATGFVEGALTQTPAAQMGIRLHMGVIPAIILAICLVIYWKKYPLTPEESYKIKMKIKELGF